MTKFRSWVGLDVHAGKVVACVVDAESGEMMMRRLPGDTAAVAAFCVGLPGPVRAAYEVGPTGFGLARVLAVSGVGCVVAAPGKIERPAQDRIKTDVRDAERLVRLLMIGGRHPVRVPSSEEEAPRDLVRAREDLRGDLMRARHRLGKLLLRYDVRYDGAGDNWTRRHRDWLAKVRLAEHGAQATLLDYLGAIDALIIRRDSRRAFCACRACRTAARGDAAAVGLSRRSRSRRAIALAGGARAWCRVEVAGGSARRLR